MNRKPDTQENEGAPDLVIDDGQVYHSSGDRPKPPRKKRRRFLRNITKKLKPIYIGPLQPDSSGILNVRGHLGFLVLCFGAAAVGFAIFEFVPVIMVRGFYCPSIAVPFGLLALGLANMEFYAMKHKSMSVLNLNRLLCKIGLAMGCIGGLAGICANILGIIYYFA